MITTLRKPPPRMEYITVAVVPLEPSLIGVGGSSCSWFLPHPWVTRFSPRSALGPPHHGVRRVGVPICMATFEATACLSAPGSYRDHLTRRSHGNDIAPPMPRAETRSPSGGNRRVSFAPAELGAISPHPVQDSCELAGDRDAGPCHAAALGDLHAPGAQGRPLPAADQQ